MPLCELKIPSDQYSSQTKEDWVRICDVVLDDTLNGLEIPDPSDREYRISVSSEIKKKEINISFSCGRDEYGIGEIFDPSRDKMQKTVNKIFGECITLGIYRVRMEKWKGTSFAILDSNSKGETSVPNRFKEGVSVDGVVRLVLSPKVVEGYSQSRNKEMSGRNNCESFRLLGERVAEFLGGAENLVDIKMAKEAEADIGVEVDLNMYDERLSDEEMDFLRDKVGEKVVESGLLNRSGEENVTLWVRQEGPEISVIEGLI